ncbi:MAG: prolyl oligopeptidase family serine peptidase, partial [Patescibacteria group bacterium]
IKCLVLVAPAFNQARLIRKWYTNAQIRRWKQKGYLDTPKFRIGIGYLKEALDYTELLCQIKIPTLIVHGRKDEKIPLEMAKEAFKKLKVKEKKITIFPQGDHHFENYFSRRKLINHSVKWFKKYL